MSKDNLPTIPEFKLEVKGNVNITLNYGGSVNQDEEHTASNYRPIESKIPKKFPRLTERKEQCEMGVLQAEYDMHLNKRDIYQINHMPKGRVLIINNEFFDNTKPRPGAEVDVKSLNQLWTWFDCQVINCKDLAGFEILREVENFAQMPGLDYCAVFVMSHGKEGDLVIGKDDKPVEVAKLVDAFEPSNCPHLEGIPKMMFFQACRGKKARKAKENDGTDNDGDDIDDVSPDSEEKMLLALLKQVLPGGRVIASKDNEDQIDVDDVDADEERFISDKPDMLIGFSTLEGEVSFRNIKLGSWYIQDLVNVFTTYSKSQDVVTMMYKVQEEIETRTARCTKEKYDGCTVTSVAITNMKKKLFFYPGCRIPR